MFFFSFIVGGLTDSYYGDEFPGIDRIGAVLGFFLIPFLAFVYGVIGSVALTILGGVFNIICKMTGGFKVEGVFESAPPAGPAPPVYHAPASPPPSPNPPAPGS